VTLTGGAGPVKASGTARIRDVAFITFEGIEGCGKSTQVRLVAERLGSRGVETREPGGTRVGQALRQIVLDPSTRALAPVSELLIYFADRAQHVAEVIRPALAQGRIVLCDRHVESSLAYQGYGRGLALDAIRALGVLATGGLRPDAIVLVDVPVELGLQRARRRGAQDRLEAEEIAFHERVRAGYDLLARQEPERWLRVDGRAPQLEVFEAVWRGLVGRGLIEDAAA
jgi:dTMP kinase